MPARPPSIPKGAKHLWKNRQAQYLLRRSAFPAPDGLLWMITEDLTFRKCSPTARRGRLPVNSRPSRLHSRSLVFPPKRYFAPIGSNNHLLIAGKVKWAFKAKPDLVIHADREHSLCIEFELEFGEGSYPFAGGEKRLLRERGPLGIGARISAMTGPEGTQYH